MIEARKLTRHYGNFVAVDNISFTVGKGETLVLIGPSGCGKTTTLKMLNKLIPPTHGSVWIGGEDTTTLEVEELRRKMGYVIQNVGLFPHYSVAENIAIVPHLLKWEASKINQRVEELLIQIGLSPNQYAHKYPNQLSGGQQQRVGIARALAAKPPILLMDEPFGALDPLTRQQLQRDFMELEALKATTIVMVTHDIEEAFEMGTHIAVLNEGRIQQLATPRTLLTQPANEFVKAFIADQAERLELRALKMKDVFHLLILDKPAQGKILEMAPSVALLHAIYTLGKQANHYISVSSNGETRYADMSQLFELFKNSLS